MTKIACLISGRGSNLSALLDAAHAQGWAERYGARVDVVISDRLEAGGLARARERGIPSRVVNSNGRSKNDFESELGVVLEGFGVELIVLAGFMRILSADFALRFRGRMINIHPSLLPAFTGLRSHERALASGVRVHGATVHFVSGQLDGGAIIAQHVVPVLAMDSVETLSARVLLAEHELLPRCVEWMVQGAVKLGVDDRVEVTGLQPDAMSFKWQ